MKTRYLIFIVLLSMLLGAFFHSLLKKRGSIGEDDSIVLQEYKITRGDTISLSMPSIVLEEIPKLTDLKDSILQLLGTIEDTKLQIRDTSIFYDTICTYIIKDYYTTRTYDTTLVSTEYLQASVKAEIGRNRLLNIALEYSVPQQVRVIQKPTHRSLDDFHIFGGVSFPTNGNVSVGVLVSPKNSRWLFGASYGLQGTVSLDAHYLLW